MTHISYIVTLSLRRG